MKAARAQNQKAYIKNFKLYLKNDIFGADDLPNLSEYVVSQVNENTKHSTQQSSIESAEEEEGQPENINAVENNENKKTTKKIPASSRTINNFIGTRQRTTANKHAENSSSTSQNKHEAIDTRTRSMK